MNLLEMVGAQAKTLRVSGGCISCPLRPNLKTSFVPATLQKGRVLFVEEGPGDTDLAKGALCSDKSGELLRERARKAGVPQPWSFTSAVHCHSGGAPPPVAIERCLSQFVLQEIADYPIIVLLGNAPLQAFFPGARMSHFRGNVAWHPDFPEQRFYTVHNPGQIFRQPNEADDFQRYLERLASIVNGESAPPWRIIRGPAAVEEFRYMCDASLLSGDLETTNLESWARGERVRSLAATVDGKTVVTATEDEPHFGVMLDLFGGYLEREDVTLVGANPAFDIEWIEQDRNTRARCKVIDVAIHWNQAGQYKQPSLKELVARELNGYRYLVHNPHLCKDPLLLTNYNAEDVVYPLQLLRKSLTVLRPKTRDLVTRVLGPVSLELRRMTSNGFYVREEYRQQKIREYEDKRAAIVQQWKATDPEFIPSVHESGKGVIQYLYEVRGLPVLERTEQSKEPSTDASVLKQFVRDGHTVVQHLLDLREVDKILGTYLKAYDKFLWPDSRVRPSFTLTLTDTGRSSAKQPNTQNIPVLKDIRDLFGVPDGHELIESDLSQIEFRIMVCRAGDENGINSYLRGEDAHTATARAITGAEKPTKEQRWLAKPVNFGFLYGARASTFQQYAADEFNVIYSDEDAQRYRDIFMETYPRIEAFHESSKQTLIKNRGWFESVVGFTYHYDQWDHRDKNIRDHVYRAALNSEAQGPAAHICFYITTLARRLLDKRGFHSVKFVNTVHDSLLTHSPNKAWTQDVIATIEEAKTQAYEWIKPWFIVPLLMDHKSGSAWGSMVEHKH